MSKRFIPTIMCSVLSLVAVTGLARSETIGRYECNIVGTPNPESTRRPYRAWLGGLPILLFRCGWPPERGRVLRDQHH